MTTSGKADIGFCGLSKLTFMNCGSNLLYLSMMLTVCKIDWEMDDDMCMTKWFNAVVGDEGGGRDRL